MDIIDRIGQVAPEREEKLKEKSKFMSALKDLHEAADPNVFLERYAKQSNEFKAAYPLNNDNVEDVRTEVSNDFQSVMLYQLEKVKHGTAFEILLPMKHIAAYVWATVKAFASGALKLAKDPTTYLGAVVAALAGLFGEWIGGKMYAWYYKDSVVSGRYIQLNGKSYTYPTPLPGKKNVLTEVDPKAKVEYEPPLPNEVAITMDWQPGWKSDGLVKELRDGEIRDTKRAQKGAANRSRGAPKVQFDEYETWQGLGERAAAGERMGSNLKKRFDFLDYKAKHEGLWRGDGAKYDVVERRWFYPHGKGKFVITERDALVDAAYYPKSEPYIRYEDDIRKDDDAPDGYVSEARRALAPVAPLTASEAQEINKWLTTEISQWSGAAPVAKGPEKDPRDDELIPEKHRPLVDERPLVDFGMPEEFSADAAKRAWLEYLAQPMPGTVAELEKQTAERNAIAHKMLVQETKKSGCHHSVDCPLVKQDLIKTNWLWPCHVKCEGHHCNHFDECQPREFVIPKEDVLQKETKSPKAVKFKPETTKCRYGDRCTRAQCAFMHPVKEAKEKSLSEWCDVRIKEQTMTNKTADKIKLAALVHPTAMLELVKEPIGSGKYPNAKGYNGKFAKFAKDIDDVVKSSPTKAPEKKEEPKQIPPAPVPAGPKQILVKPKPKPTQEVKTVSQAVANAFLPHNFEWVAFNQLTRGKKGQGQKPDDFPMWDILLKQKGADRPTIYKRSGWFKKFGDDYKFIYNIPNKEGWQEFKPNLKSEVEKDSQGKVWYTYGVSVNSDEIKSAMPYVMSSIATLEGTPLPTGENTAPRPEGKSRNGLVPASLLNTIVLVTTKDGQEKGIAARCGAYGLTSKHVVDEVRSIDKTEVFWLDCGTDRTMVTPKENCDYDLTAFKWPTGAAFQAVTTTVYAGPTTVNEISEKRKIAVVTMDVVNGKRIPGISSGVSDMINGKRNKVRGDYGTFGGGASGSPVFTEVGPGAWHLVGIHTERDENTEKNWFSLIPIELSKRLNSPAPTQKSPSQST